MILLERMGIDLSSTEGIVKLSKLTCNDICGEEVARSCKKVEMDAVRQCRAERLLSEDFEHQDVCRKYKSLMDVLGINIPKKPKRRYSIYIQWDECPTCGVTLRSKESRCSSCLQIIEWE